jgi:hypothetical protein
MNRALLIALAWVSAVGVHAQELTEGAWSGTLTRVVANNPRPQRQKLALEIKKAPDPHWAWRPGGGDTWNITVISQQGGRSQATGFELKADSLSFAYRLQDDIVTCRLTRQPDATFEGDCVDASSTRRLILTPTKPPAK